MINGIFYVYYWRYRKNRDADIALGRSILSITVIQMPYFCCISTMFFLICGQMCPSKVFAYLIAIDNMVVMAILIMRFLHKKKYRRILANHKKYNTKKYRYITNMFLVGSLIATALFGMLLMNDADKRSKEVEAEDDYGTGLTIIGVSTDDTIQVYPNPSESDH